LRCSDISRRQLIASIRCAFFSSADWLAKRNRYDNDTLDAVQRYTHSFKKSAPLLDPGPYQWPYQTQSSVYRGLKTRYLLVSRRLCLIITPIKPQLRPTFCHKGCGRCGSAALPASVIEVPKLHLPYCATLWAVQLAPRGPSKLVSTTLMNCVVFTSTSSIGSVLSLCLYTC
jgi:hypothetical protein